MKLRSISRFTGLFSLLLLFTNCGDDGPASVYVNLPADSPVLVVGEQNNTALTQVQSWLEGKQSSVAPYRMLEEDSLFNYRNLVLVRPHHDSLNAHRRTSVERFVAAGGRLVIADDRDAEPYRWAWYERQRTSGNGTTRQEGMGQTLVAMDDAGAATAFFASTINPAPAASHDLPIPAPKDDRFQIQVLDDQIYEPMEMEILPDGSVLFLERRGLMKLNKGGKTTVVHDFPVCIEGNYEDGLHGVALDPKYGKENHWIYVYYSPLPCDSTDQFLSRFEFKNGVLDTTSEIVVLRVPVQRKSCCHSGGSVEFDRLGNLYLSTGDNTSSKESNGYSPLDERPGRGPYDSQKSSGNTNDLRGKILRITPTADGGYTIPEGNLFPNGEGGKAEIFVMGARNPFRIALDPWTHYLYWGDVGPDVGEAGKFGPESFDEWNQAMTAGNYGWPYFVGNNFGYPDRDFSTETVVGPPQDPNNPINDSPNNTGARELPPARPALIWYPYGPSKEFPVLGEGSRSAMAGPFYDKENLVPITNSALPEYYHGKWFIYEWGRSWIKVVTFDSTRQHIMQMENFLPNHDISKPIDMKIGRDGAVYLLEYGNDYFANNPDARLTRISYSGRNRPPVANLYASENAGGLPFQPNLSAAGSSDPDPDDSLRIRWFVDGSLEAETMEFTPMITKPGEHQIRLQVVDQAGATAEQTLTVAAGNARPVLALELEGNRSFLLPGQENLRYSASVDDAEDRMAGRLEQSKVLVNATWVADDKLAAGLRKGTDQLPSGDLAFAAGAALIEGSDCLTCHNERRENVGPSYLAVAERYDDTQANINMLAGKVITGGNGNWGERLMSGHPTLAPEDARTMVGYILSLNNGGLPLAGSVRPGAGQGSYVLAASYRDGGGKETEPLVGQRAIVLRSPRLEAENAYDGLYRAAVPGSGENFAFNVVAFRPGGWLRMDNIDLRGLSAVKLGLHGDTPGELELRHGSPEGELIASASITPTQPWDGRETITLSISDEAQELPMGSVYLYWKGEGGAVADDMGHHRPGNVGWVDWIEVVGGGLAR